LIVFAIEITPALELELLYKEDESIFLDRAIKHVCEALSSSADLRYVWALVKTMDKWEDYRTYNEQTFPALQQIFEGSLNRNDLPLAQEIYAYARQTGLSHAEVLDG